MRARCLTVYANGEPVVKCANFEVGPGEMALLYGPTGGGKSSIVKALAGIYRYSGEARLERPYFIFRMLILTSYSPTQTRKRGL